MPDTSLSSKLSPNRQLICLFKSSVENLLYIVYINDIQLKTFMGYSVVLLFLVDVLSLLNGVEYSLSQVLGLYSLSRRRLMARSREISKSRNSTVNLSNRSEIQQVPRQRCGRNASQISKRYDQYNTQSHGFEILRDLAVRRRTA